MKKLIIYGISLTILTLSGCKKNEDGDSTIVDTPVTELEVLTDFANVLVNPNYKDIEAKSNTLNIAAQTLANSKTDANLAAAQNAWRAVRAPWEQCEAFIFGPVEDFNYDPATDTWPVNTVELDSLLASSIPLTLAVVDSLPYSLKGYHPIEYVLFGVGGSRTAAQLTARELEYLVALTQSLLNSNIELRKSWDPLHGNFTQDLTTAGIGSTRYATREDAFVAITSAMAGLCNEVANGKMNDPLVAHDSTLVESQYAHNATQDFRNNLIGIRNAYMCKYTNTGKSIHDIVASYDISFDNTIQSQINSAISSLDNIDPNYGLAIFTQQGQIIASQNAINTLESTLNGLTNFMIVNIKD